MDIAIMDVSNKCIILNNGAVSEPLSNFKHILSKNLFIYFFALDSCNEDIFNLRDHFTHFEVVFAEKIILYINIYIDEDIITIKNAIMYIGSTINAEKRLKKAQEEQKENKDENKVGDYWPILFKKINDVNLYLTLLKIDPIKVYSFQSIVQLIIKDWVSTSTNNYININVNESIISKEEFIYKYFYLLVQKYNKLKKYVHKFNLLCTPLLNIENYDELIYTYEIEFNKYFLSNENKLIRFVENLLNKDSTRINNINLYIKNPNTSIYFLSKEDVFIGSKAFMGSRVELIKNVTPDNYINSFSENWVYNCDLKQAYFSNLDSKYPIGSPKVLHVNKPFDGSSKFDNLCLYTCKVKSLHKYLPVLPFRYKDKLVFPNGVFTGTWWGEELNYFLECGGVVEFIYCIYYWDDYIEDIKRVFNKIDSIDLPIDLKWVDKKFKLNIYGYFGKKNQIINKKTYNKNTVANTENIVERASNYYYASYIVTKTRILIHKLSDIINKNNLNLLYINTDGIYFYCSEFEYENLLKNYKEYFEFWTKVDKLEDFFALNSRVVFIKYERDNNYRQLNNKELHSSKEIAKLKAAFFKDGNCSHSLGKTTYQTNSYTKRLWVQSKCDSNPLFMNQGKDHY